METILVKVYIHCPVERVWGALGDYEGYKHIRGVSEARLLRPGSCERNGVGSLRLIKFFGATFIEEILTYKPPWRIEYAAREVNIPFRHDLGRVDFIPRGEGTEVHWLTRFEIPLPVVGGCLGKLAQFVFQRFFYDALMEVKSRLEEKPTA